MYHPGSSFGANSGQKGEVNERRSRVIRVTRVLRGTWVITLLMLVVISGINSEISQASSTKAGSTCQKIGTASRQGSSNLQCQRKNGKLIWVATKLQTTKKDPLPIVTSDDFEVSTDSGDLTATIPSENLIKLVSEYHVTSFIARFVINNGTFTVPVAVTSDNLEVDGSLNLVKPDAYSGDWAISILGVNATGQGSWSDPEQFTVPPALQNVVAPNFTLSFINGNLTATVESADVQQSIYKYHTTDFVAQFTSPSGNVTRTNYSIQDSTVNALITINSPASGTWSVELAGTNGLGLGSWSVPEQYLVSETPTPPPPDLQCGATPQVAFQKPGWQSSSASKLATTWISTTELQATWCPASALSTGDGYGPIIYTVTVDPGGETCTTWTGTSCIIKNVPSGASTSYLMATNEVGTNVAGISTIVNSGQIDKCDPIDSNCYPGPTYETFPAYGNTDAALGDCTFAAAADWEQLNLGIHPDQTTIGYEFHEAGGSETNGLDVNTFFSYWKNHGIAGVVAKKVSSYYTDQIDVENGIRDYGELLAELSFSPGQNIAGLPASGGKHMLVVDGFTPQGPVVVTWGTTLQMTWQQWNLEVVGMWGINN